MWNSLHDDIKNIDSFNRFKKGLKLYIQNQPCNEEQNKYSLISNMRQCNQFKLIRLL